ncbi:MAG: hypothetical protein HFI05_00290 [Lachnospiraceae bacterium]|jgi:hypothetical protein|nr:hypothetical protein [Lachnospiraceae bacterium]
MILYKKENISLLQQNIIMLEYENSNSMIPDGFIYVSQSTYDEALLLFDRFEGESGILKKVLNVTNHIDAIKFFHKYAPKPISILAPFLGLIREDIELKEDIEMLCGMLHQMSQIINFNSFTKVPLDVRADIVFTKSMLNNYKKSWEDLELRINMAEVNKESLTVDMIKTIVGEIAETVIEKLSMKTNMQSAIAQTNKLSTEDKNLDSNNYYTEDIDPWSKLNSMFEEIEEEESKEENSSISISEQKEEIKEDIVDEKTAMYDRIAQMYGGM